MPFRALGLTPFILLSFAGPCWAQPHFLVDPSTLSSVGLDEDDGVARRTLPSVGTFQFFGQTKTTVDISVNGHLNFSLDQNFANTPLPTNINVQRIAALYDDFVVSSTGANIVDNQGETTRAYYAATWLNVGVFGGDAAHSFQAVWFSAATNIESFNFLPGDIAFDYASLGNAFRNETGEEGATVGLDLSDGTHAAVLPGSAAGVILDTALLPANDDRFVLFRYDLATNSYSVTIQGVPEPSTWLMLIGIAGLAGYRYARRVATVQTPVAVTVD